jgi:trehalose 6-phosphate synthase/phosphatase
MGQNQYSRLIIVAYRLPFHFVKKQEQFFAEQNSGGLVSAILAISGNKQPGSDPGMPSKILWVGAGDPMPENIANGELFNRQFDLVPVNIPEDIQDNYYGGFCNDLIWPLFHYFSPFTVFDDKYFDAYTRANELFASALQKVLQPGDLVWIHDYQLLLLPELVRAMDLKVHIGFFLHIPFPSFEVFRYIPRKWRKAILNGMLGANLVGFHTEDYAHYFIRSVEHTLGHRFKENIILSGNRKIQVGAFPIGIDYRHFHDACTTKPVEREKKKIRKSIGSSKLIFSVDRLDYSKGLLERLKGYETFLQRFPEWRSKVICNMVVVPSRDTIQRYRTLKNEIEATTGRINGEYGTLDWRPVVYQYKSLRFEELVALYDMSDVGLITPVRDGMNLVAKEYVACQVDRKGVLILSEMAGAAAELTESLIINPTDKNEMADAIRDALEMPSDAKKSRMLKMQKQVESSNVFAWSGDFLTRLTSPELHISFRNHNLLDEHQLQVIQSLYTNSSSRIIFLDYDGTLVPFHLNPKSAVPDKEVLGLITSLAKDEQNEVVIISGREMKYLESTFKGIPVSIVSEHGYQMRDRQGTITGNNPLNSDWKKSVLGFLQSFTSQYTGSIVEEKQSSLAFHFRGALHPVRPEDIRLLKNYLNNLKEESGDLEVLEGKKVLEIKQAGYNKGTAARRFLDSNPHGFILAVGDDTTDEALFMAMPEHAFTVKIGTDDSFAQYYLEEQPEITKLLSALHDKAGDQEK